MMDRQLEILLQRAAEGDAWAQKELAKFDIGDLPVQSQKYSEPIYMRQLKARAEQNDVEAQYQLGWQYANGEKRLRNYKTAAKWFRKAAKQGNTPAQRELGYMYYDGEGVVQNFEKAVYWWEQAAEAGDSWAMTNLGYYYFDNAPEAPDYVSAMKWWKQAAEHGDDIAAYNLHILYSEQEDKKDESRKWLRRSAELGNAQAQYMVYLESKGVEIYWLLRAAEQGFRKAVDRVRETCNDKDGKTLVDLEMPGDIQFLLGVLHEKGHDGLEANVTEAVKWYRAAAKQGHAEAQFTLGICYDEGHGVEQDYAEAVKWYRLAAEQGHAGAQFNLGTCYDEGQGVEQDYTEAAKWYRLAAEQGDADAQSRLEELNKSPHHLS